MPRQILFIQGAGATAHDEWDVKLVQSLERELGRDYSIRYPRMPDADDPRYQTWKAALLHEFDVLEDGAILVGHSIGGTVLIHVLADKRPKFRPGALILISTPFIGEGGWPSDDIIARTNFSQRLPVGLPVLIYHGSEDETVPFAHAELYAKAIPQAVVRSLPHRDHQLNNDLSEVAQDILKGPPFPQTADRGSP
ncbi:alpha/beta fold hydrolase [Rhizobium jaguaris]|uniref:Alpha/beta fold hydrolase n=1 Tax=Rhizobium jaguaris TaxID=1312183 RepID=A0A387G4P4_9HYPH|nr:alpha/beta fold hydrolase [Rhizobium jaguaris]AYG62991.1 alpha/beta fold hydrolase [Rhizobium jaguaris]